MTALLSPNAKQQFFTDGSTVASGFRLYTYRANTTTPASTYTNRAGTTPNTNPIILDARGEATIYLTPGVVYDYVLKTDQGVTVWTREDVIADAGDANAVSYTASGTGAFTRPIQGKADERPSVLDYIDPARHAGIAAGTDQNDTSAGFNAALAAHDVVEVPAGEYWLTDGVTVSLGHKLIGAGRRKTIIRVPDTFNLSADGVLRFAPGADAGEIRGMTIIFEQPDSATLADYTQYPPAIYAVDTPRFKIADMRIALCWDGVDMTGNSGGGVIDDLELSMFNKGIILDGSLDTNRIDKLHLWPFASVTQGVMTTNQRLVNRDAYGIYSGRVDGLFLSNSLIFDVRKGVYCYSPGAGLYTIGNFSNVGFDGDGGLHVIGEGRIQLSSCYFTKDSSDGNWIVQTGGIIEVVSARMVNSVTAISGRGLIDISGGTLNLGAVQMERGFLDSTFVYASGVAMVNIHGAHLASDAAAVFTKPAIHFAGSVRGNITGVTASSKTGGSGSLITIDNDIGVTVSGIQAQGWTIDGPAARANTRVDSQDRFVGCVSSAGASNGLPFGWTCSRAGVGNYSITHNLGLSAVRDMVFTPTPEGTAFASWDVASSTPSGARVRTFDAAGAPVDVAFSFSANRRR